MSLGPHLWRLTSLNLQLHSWRRLRPRECLFCYLSTSLLLTSLVLMLTARLFQNLIFLMAGWVLISDLTVSNHSVKLWTLPRPSFGIDLWVSLSLRNLQLEQRLLPRNWRNLVEME